MAKLMRALQVRLEDFRGDGDRMLRVFVKGTAGLVLAMKKGSRFRRRPTRAARKRRGDELERRRAANPEEKGSLAPEGRQKRRRA